MTILNLSWSLHPAEKEIAYCGEPISAFFLAIDTIPEMGFGMT